MGGGLHPSRQRSLEETVKRRATLKHLRCSPLGPASLLSALTGEYCCANMHSSEQRATLDHLMCSPLGACAPLVNARRRILLCNFLLASTAMLAIRAIAQGAPSNSQLYAPQHRERPPTRKRLLVSTAAPVLNLGEALAAGDCMPRVNPRLRHQRFELLGKPLGEPLGTA